MVSLKEGVMKKKRVRKCVVYVPEPQSRPHLRVRKCLWQDPKIIWYENSWIMVGKPDKSVYGMIIMYFTCTLHSANKLVSAVSDLQEKVPL